MSAVRYAYNDKFKEHVWIETQTGRTLCADGITPQEARLQSHCYPLAKRFAETGTTQDALAVPASPPPPVQVAQVQPSPVQYAAASLVTPEQVFARDAVGGLLALLMFGFLACTIGGIFWASLRMAPAKRTEGGDLPLWGEQYAEPLQPMTEPTPKTELAEPEPEFAANRSEVQAEPFAVAPRTVTPAVRVGARLVDLPLRDFKVIVPAGGIDCRAITLRTVKEAAMGEIWKAVTGEGITNTEKLAWMVFGISKGGEPGTPRRQWWDNTSGFIKLVVAHIQSHGSLPLGEAPF